MLALLQAGVASTTMQGIFALIAPARAEDGGGGGDGGGGDGGGDGDGSGSDSGEGGGEGDEPDKSDNSSDSSKGSGDEDGIDPDGNDDFHGADQSQRVLTPPEEVEIALPKERDLIAGGWQ